MYATISILLSFYVIGVTCILRSNRCLYYFCDWNIRVRNFIYGKTVFNLRYYGGFNIHFETSYNELKKLLPKHLEPIKMAIVDGDVPEYIVTMYTADVGRLNDSEGKRGVLPRADLFTYIRDNNGDIGIAWLCVFIKYPNSKAKYFLKMIMKFVGMDTIDFTEAYPHYDAKQITISDKEFLLHVKETKIDIRENGDNSKKVLNKSFHMDFVKANSKCYRGVNGVCNVNYFNQSFINATITRWNIDNLVVKGNLTDFHPVCKKIIGIESYGGRDKKPIVWYIDND